MELSELKQSYIKAIYDTKSFRIREEAFPLKSGLKSHLYLNHRNFLTKSKYLILISQIYNKLLEEISGNYNLAIVDSIMSPIIVGAMSALAQKDITVIRSKKLAHGTQEEIYGSVNGNFVIVDDMTSTGGTIIEAAKKIRANNGIVKHCIVSACRNNDAKNNLEKHDIKLHFIANFDEIIEQLKPYLSENELEIIELKTQ